MATKQKLIRISGLEQQLLRDYVKTSPLVLLRFKAQAVLLAAHGVESETIAVEAWLTDWNQRRLASIFTGYKDNRNAGKLTSEQLEEVRPSGLAISSLGLRLAKGVLGRTAAEGIHLGGFRHPVPGGQILPAYPTFRQSQL